MMLVLVMIHDFLDVTSKAQAIKEKNRWKVHEN